MGHSPAYLKNQQSLKQLMQQVQISDLDRLSEVAGVSRLQFFRLQNGLVEKMQLDTLLKIAAALQISLNSLVNTFSEASLLPDSSQPEAKPDPTENKLESLQQEYQRLQQEYQRLQQHLEQQRESLIAEFQQSSLHTLESWLLQWPTATAAVEKNPLLPAERLVKLVNPVENLLKQWQIEAISSVGAEIPFDPQFHQLLEGTAEPGDLVKVRYVGYCQGEKLLYRAKVSPIYN